MTVIASDCNSTALPKRHRKDSIHRPFPSNLAGNDRHVIVDGAIEDLEDGVMECVSMV